MVSSGSTDSAGGVVVRFRYLVVALAAATIALAVLVVPKAAVQPLPDFMPTYVEVQTEALGLSASEVEQMVTVPLEADILNGIEGLTVIRSQSLTGLSRIVLVFGEGIDQYVARSRVQERLTLAAGLPAVSKPPVMLPPLSTESRLMMFSLDSTRITPIQASVLARWTIRPRLMGVPGVANVEVWGQRDRQLQVQIDPAKLAAQGVTISQVVESVGDAQIVSPLTYLEASSPGTGGFIETSQQRLQVRHVFDKLATAAEMAKVPLVDAQGLRVSDVATVVEGHQPLIGDNVVHDSGTGLLFVVEKFPGADARQVAHDVQVALDELAPGLANTKVSTGLFDATDYTRAALSSLTRLGLVVAALLVVALGVWFANVRLVAFALATLATGVAAALAVLALTVHGFNSMTLAGLGAAAFALVADVVGRFNEASRPASARDPGVRRAALRGRSIALALSACAVAPAAVMAGRPGALVWPAVLGYAAGCAAAFVAAAVVAPALASLLPQPVQVSWVRRRMRRVTLAPRRGIAVAVVLALAVVSIVGFAAGHRQMLPTIRDRDVVVDVASAPGTSLPAMTAAVAQARKSIEGVPGVQTVTGQIGRAVGGDQSVDVNSAQLWVVVGASADYDRSLTGIREAVGGFGRLTPALTGTVSTYLQQRLSAVGDLDDGRVVTGTSFDTITGDRYPLVVRVYGQDAGTLANLAGHLRSALAGQPGLTDVSVIGQPHQRSISIVVNPDKAQAKGFSPGDVRRAEAILVQGIQVGSVFEGQKVFDVVVQGDAATRASVASISNLQITNVNGDRARLGDVADVTITDVPVAIDRDDVARFVDVVATPKAMSSAQATAAAHRAIATVQFPLEYHAEVKATSTATELDVRLVLGVAVGALLAVVVLFQAALRRWSLALLGVVAVAASLAGSAVASMVVGTGIASLCGVLAVFGVAVRMVLSIFARSDADGSDAGGASGLAQRLADFLGVATVLALCCIPVLAFGTRAGLELLRPLALVGFAGLVSTVGVALVAGSFVGRSVVAGAANGGGQ